MSNTPSYWPAVNVPRGRGTSVVDGFAIVLFLDRSIGDDPTPAIKAIELFLAQPVLAQLHFYVDDDGYTCPLPDDPLAWVANYVTGHANSGEFTDLRLLDHEQTGSHFHARFSHDPSLNPDWPDDKSFVSFRISQEAFSEFGTAATLTLIDHLCMLLPFSYGYASPALFCDNFFEDALPWLRRHPGFDVLDTVAAGCDVGDRALGSYWINLFGPRLSLALGGAEALRAALPPQAQVHACGHGGCRVVLGDRPEVGDVNRQIPMPLYRALAAVLQPHLHVPRVTYFTDAAGMPDSDAQVVWHGRFL